MRQTPRHLQTPADRKNNCFKHFSRRLAERVSTDINATTLWLEIIEAVKDNGTENVVFIARLNRDGRRLWRVKVSSKTFFVVFDHKLNCPVTILPTDGHCYKQSGKSYERVNLGAFV